MVKKGVPAEWLESDHFWREVFPPKQDELIHPGFLRFQIEDAGELLYIH